MQLTPEKEKTLERLVATLQEYLDAVPRQKEANPPDLLEIFKRLDAFETELDASYPAQLRHYVHQKSYRKAYLFLQGLDSENVNGNCKR